MPMIMRLKSKRRRNRKIKKAVMTALVVLAVVLTPLFVYLLTSEKEVVPPKTSTKGIALSEMNATPKANVDYITKVEDASSQLNGEWLGVCKKNSIHSVADFKRTVETDEVLSRHFAGFNWKNARLGRQDEAMLVHVTHRKGDVIKPTSKPIKLPKGDGYITDGVRTIRTYCCNDIDISPSAGLPETPVAAVDPPKSSTPEIFPPEEETSPYVEVIDPPTIKHPFGRPIIHSPKPSPDHQPVPEPSTFFLMGIGLVALAAACRKKKN